MTKTLVKHGNSYALIIERPIMELLGLTPETPLRMEVHGRMLTVSAQQSGEDEDAEIQTLLDRAKERYAPMLKRLAE